MTPPDTLIPRAVVEQALEDMEARKDAAYLERNQVVAALAKCFPSGVAKTAIEGWSEDWHGCVYINLPTGQVSWHFHDSQAYLFKGLPAYSGKWDGHDTDEKYRRVAALQPQATAWQTLSQQIQEAAIASGQKQRPRENNQGIASDAWLHPIGTCSPERNGENQHHEHRAGESDAKCTDCKCDSECTRVSGAGQVRAEQVAQTAAEPVAWFQHKFITPAGTRADLAEVVSALLDRQDRLEALITKLHAAKGRYHTQLAACDLFDAVGLKNERPVK